MTPLPPPVLPFGACGVRGCRSPHPYEPIAERFTHPLDRTPWMAYQAGTTPPDSLWRDVRVIALAIAFLLGVYVLAGGWPG